MFLTPHVAAASSRSLRSPAPDSSPEHDPSPPRILDSLDSIYGSSNGGTTSAIRSVLFSRTAECRPFREAKRSHPLYPLRTARPLDR